MNEKMNQTDKVELGESGFGPWSRMWWMTQNLAAVARFKG